MNQKIKTPTHYHVLGGLHGCIPSLNNVFDDIETSKMDLTDMANDLKESGNKLSGDFDGMYYEITEKSDALIDYIEIVDDCRESDCLKEFQDD